MKFVFALTVSCLLILQVAGLDELCESDSDCNDKNNERCQRYDACSSGRCVCQAGLLKHMTSDLCIGVTKIGDSCNISDSYCGRLATCTGGKCVCVSGTAENPDKVDCTPPSFELSCSVAGGCADLGGVCSATNICECKGETEKVSGIYYLEVSKKFVDLCVHKRAKTGIKEGARCNTDDPRVGPTLYCDAGLICGRCPEHDTSNYPNQNICIKGSFSSGILVSANVGLFVVISMVAKLV